ncbi:hypothetical protein LTR97_007869 [Elasticomyces elasticus]|uniref:Uncharacterized protein n=1 Tax=Elasticomyces elasticus TaxID=574655 RepID=A0AAN7W8M0_9PEZI|nr:hypothetical protein LTR97_007869 [Elasticomyces elasticus]
MVVVAKIINDKYQKQQQQAEKRTIASSSSTQSGLSRVHSQSLSDQANEEILAKTGIAPPSYQEVMETQHYTRQPPADDKQGWSSGEAHDKEDADLWEEVSQWLATRHSSHDHESLREKEAAEVYHAASDWLEERQSRLSQASNETVKEDWRTRWQRQKAERAVRRAERRSRGGCCC